MTSPRQRKKRLALRKLAEKKAAAQKAAEVVQKPAKPVEVAPAPVVQSAVATAEKPAVVVEKPKKPVAKNALVETVEVQKPTSDQTVEQKKEDVKVESTDA